MFDKNSRVFIGVCVCRGGGAVCGRVDGEHHVKQKPINTKCTNIIHACTLNCYMRQQRGLLIRVTSVPSLISSRPVLGSRSKPGLKALAWARFGCVKNVHYINIWYPPKPIQSVILDRLSSRWCTNPRQSDESRSDNSRGKSCPATAECWRESRRWELLGSEPSW